MNNSSPVNLLNLVKSGSVRSDLKIDGSKRVELRLSRGKIEIQIESLDLLKLIVKITKFLKPEVATEEIETRRLGTLESFKIFKKIADDLAKSRQTVTVVYKEKEIIKIGEDAKPMITGIFLKHVEVIDKTEALTILKNLSRT